MISVAMAVFNGEKYIREQLDSIFSQTRPVDEIVIVDDGSTDDTVKIIRETAKSHPEIRLVLNEKNLGYKQNFCKAMSLVQGDITFLCDQDDKWEPEKVQVMMRIFEENTNVQVLASSFMFMDSDSIPFKVEPKKGMSNNNMYLKEVSERALVSVTFEEFCSHNYFQGCSMALTREIREQFIEKFTDRIPHDWLIALIGSRNQGFFFLNRPLFCYRIHESNTIGVPEGRKNEEWVRLQTARDVINAMTVVHDIFPEYWHDHPECRERLAFSQEHLEALINRSVSALLRQNMNPYYWELKRFRARIMDLFFVITHKHRKGEPQL